MAELTKIQPTQHVLPTLQDQHDKRKKENTEPAKKKSRREPEDTRERKVDEYI